MASLEENHSGALGVLQPPIRNTAPPWCSDGVFVTACECLSNRPVNTATPISSMGPTDGSVGTRYVALWPSKRPSLTQEMFSIRRRRAALRQARRMRTTVDPWGSSRLEHDHGCGIVTCNNRAPEGGATDGSVTPMSCPSLNHLSRRKEQRLQQG